MPLRGKIFAVIVFDTDLPDLHVIDEIAFRRLGKHPGRGKCLQITYIVIRPGNLLFPTFEKTLVLRFRLSLPERILRYQRGYLYKDAARGGHDQVVGISRARSIIFLQVRDDDEHRFVDKLGGCRRCLELRLLRRSGRHSKGRFERGCNGLSAVLTEPRVFRVLIPAVGAERHI